jgi:hypothetical protein
LREIPGAAGEIPFFRHRPSYNSKQGRPFGEKYWYKWWVKACASLGIKGVDLYGGTRHSSVRAMRHTILDSVHAWACDKCGKTYFEEKEADAIQDLIRSVEQKARALEVSA